MARRNFEHMLEELERINYPPLPRWFAPPGFCYNFGDMGNDFRNVTRMNRYDLCGIDFRQPYWMVDRAKISEIMSQYERRHQTGCNRDDGRLSRFNSSNNDLCQENMIDPRLTNFKQMFDSRNPPPECVANAGIPQTGRSSSSLPVNSPSNFSKMADVEWQDKNDKASKNSCTADSQGVIPSNFDSSYASWYCPEEQQQIVDMLKEVNLRHERQLKRDLLLSRGEQILSDESALSNADSEPANISRKSSLSSDDEDEDNINIILSPGPTPPIPEALNEEGNEELKTSYEEKSATDFYEEFQSIFTVSPEKKIINDMIKENSQKPLEVQDDQILGRVITQDDKNAVKTVLDFDHMEEYTEMPVSSNTISYSPKETSNGVIERKMKEHTSSSNNNANCEKTANDGKVYETSKTLNPGIETSNESNRTSNFHICSKQRKVPRVQQKCALDLPHNSQTECTVHWESFFQSNINKNISCQPTEHQNASAKLINQNDRPEIPENNKLSHSWGKKKGKRSGNGAKKVISKQGKERFSEAKKTNNNINEADVSHYQSNCVTECHKSDTSSFSSAQKYFIPKELKCFTSAHMNVQNCPKTVNEINCVKEKDLYPVKNHPALENPELFAIRDKAQETGSNLCSMSEPFLNYKKSDVVYKRISLSEIFDSVNKTYNSEFKNVHVRKSYKPHFLSQFANKTNLSPSDHLKKILGIGKNYYNNSKGDNSIMKKVNNNETRSGISKSMLPTGVYATKEDISEVSQPSYSKISNSMSLQNYSTKINSSNKKLEITPSNNCLDTSKTQKKGFDKHKKSSKNTNYNSNFVNSPQGHSKEVNQSQGNISVVFKESAEQSNNIRHKNINYNSNFVSSVQDSSKEFVKYKGSKSVVCKQSEEQSNNIRHKNDDFISKKDKTKEDLTATQYNDVNCKADNDAIKISKENMDGTINVPRNSVQKLDCQNDLKINTSFCRSSTGEHSKTAYKKSFKDTKFYASTENSQEMKEGEKKYSESNSSKELKAEPSRNDKCFYKKKANLDSGSNKHDSNSKVNNFNNVGQHFSRKYIFKRSCNKYVKKKNSPIKETETSYEKCLYSTPMNPNKNDFSKSNVAFDHTKNANLDQQSNIGENQNKYSETYSNKNTSSTVTLFHISDNKDNNKTKEDTTILKSKTTNSNRNNFLGDRKQTSSINSLKECTYKKFQYSQQDPDKSNNSGDFNSSKTENVYNSKYLTAKNYGLKPTHIAKSNKHEKETLGNICSASKKCAPLVNVCANAPSVDAKFPLETHLNEVCQRTTYNTSCLNEEDKGPTILNCDSFSGIQKNFNLTEITPELKNTTQNMAREAEKIAFCVKVPNIELSAVRERSLHQDNSKKDMTLSQFSRKEVELFPKFSDTDGHNNISSSSLQFEKIARDRISSYPSNFMVECSVKTARGNKCVISRKCYRNNNLRITGKFINLCTGFQIGDKCNINTPKPICVVTPKPYVIIPSLNIVDRYSRELKASKMNPLLDIHANLYLGDYFSQLCPVMLSSDLQNALMVRLNTIIADNLLHALPLLLNVLSVLSLSQIPWNRAFLKEILQGTCLKKDKIPENAVRPRSKEIFRNFVNDALQCWDILSVCLAR